MKLKNLFKGGEVFLNNKGAVIVVTKTTLDVDEVHFLVEYKVSSSAPEYVKHNYEYKLQKEDSFVSMLKDNNYIRIDLG